MSLFDRFKRKPKPPAGPPPTTIPSALQALPPFSYELVRVAPADAVRTCLSLRETGKGVFTPIILDSPEKYQESVEATLAERSQEKDIAASRNISVEEFFQRRREQNPAYYDGLDEGAWPDKPYVMEPYLPRVLENDVFIIKVPTPHSYEALAHIGFGGWNDCPTDEEHIAVLRYWHERCGANLFAVGTDMLECTVDRPPTTKEEALKLAGEHSLYAPGTFANLSGKDENFSALAATLLHSRHWVFWWD